MRLLTFAAVILSPVLPATAQDIVDGKKVVRTADQAIWLGTLTKGDVVHIATGATFPEGIDEWKREGLTALGNGDDAFVRYTTDKQALTIYLFKPSNLPEHSLSGALTSLGIGSQGAFVWSEGPFDVDGPQRLRLYKGTFKTGIGAASVLDYLYFGELGGWTLKVRATMPATADVTKEERLDKIVRNLPWGAVLKANGNCSGKACGAALAAAFDHHMGEMFLTQVISSGQGEKVSGGAGEPLLSRTAGGRTWAVHPLDERFGELFRKGFGALSVSAQLYSLSWKDGKKAGMVRFFSGKPDEALFNSTVDALVARPELTLFVSPGDAAVNFPY